MWLDSLEGVCFVPNYIWNILLLPYFSCLTITKYLQFHCLQASCFLIYGHPKMYSLWKLFIDKTLLYIRIYIYIWPVLCSYICYCRDAHALKWKETLNYSVLVFLDFCANDTWYWDLEGICWQEELLPMVLSRNLSLSFSAESSIEEELKRESTADVITIIVSPRLRCFYVTWAMCKR